MLRVLADPLPIALVILIFAVLSCWFRSRKAAAIALISITVFALTALSMPIVAQRLQDSLAEPRGDDTPPDYVVVLSAGSDSGASPDLDSLDEETTKRLLFGLQLWKKHPSARLVFTGASHGPRPWRETQLMGEAAQCRGVPPQSVVIEPRAMNTREHPRRLRAIGIPATARLAIVTSPWHERRAMIEFRKYFPNATPRPVPRLEDHGLVTWIPDFPGLIDSTYATREWAAIAWYRVLDRIGR